MAKPKRNKKRGVPLRLGRNRGTGSGSLIRNSSSVSRSVTGSRSLPFRPQISDGKPGGTSWIDTIAMIGSFALKVLSVFLAKSSYLQLQEGTTDKYVKIEAAVLAPICATQCVLLGPDDILANSPTFPSVKISNGTATLARSVTMYRSARITSLAIKVVPQAKRSEVVGQVACAIAPMNRDEAVGYWDSFRNQWKRVDSDLLDFLRVAQLPGAVVGPSTATHTLKWRPTSTDFGGGFQALGTSNPGDANNTPSGGWHACKLHIAYQNTSASDATLDPLYGPQAASFLLEIKGTCQVKDADEIRYLRTNPVVLGDSSKAGVLFGSAFRDLTNVEYANLQTAFSNTNVVCVHKNPPLKDSECEGFESLSLVG